ncbi:hypothetical protein OnM2_051034 [Erysiphe neolycopersici]|uniref:Uncharacterized protein n=1 Tax=Erysiphe neolycopersici TaxID=212602 RepID=A0A420HSH9_9PEZI|nr:hypothetical protein OnM2_051034 [Erysiphe neolycopersici]
MWSEKSLKVFLKSRQLPPEVHPNTTSSVIVPVNTSILTSSTPGSLNPHQNADSQTPIVAITAASLALIVAFIFGFYILRHCREIRKASSSSFSNNFFKSLWPKSNSSQKERLSGTNEQQGPAPREHVAEATDSGSLEMAINFERPDRAASFRSVITLPSYIPTARQDEQVLGREGERGGIDVVVEFPTTAEEIERQREEEMEALYQVRLARRRENETREERRRTRRATRERGETSTPRQYGESRRHSNMPGQTIEELRAAHERLKISRQRAVSIVSYAELGVARHDGSRVNPGISENEQIGLLGDAASISANPFTRGRDGSLHSIVSTSSEIPYPLIPQFSKTSNSHYVPSLTQSDVPPPALSSEPEHNFSPSPLFMTHMWDSSRIDLNRANSNAQSSILSRSDSSNIEEENNFSENIPPDYREIPLESPMESEELPPNYSFTNRQGNQKKTKESVLDSSISELLEGDSNIKNAASGSDKNESDNSVTNPSGNSTSDSSHHRRIARSDLRELPEIRTQVVPSIQINPASPTVDRGLENPLE